MPRSKLTIGVVLICISIISIALFLINTQGSDIPFQLLSFQANAEIGKVAISPDGSAIAAIEGQSTVLRWNLTDDSNIIRWTTAGSQITAIGFTHDHAVVITGDTEGRIAGWFSNTGQLAYQVAGRSLIDTPQRARNIRSLYIHPEQDMAVAGNKHGDIIIFNSRTGTVIHAFRWRPQSNCPECVSQIKAITLSHDGSLLAFSGTTGKVVLWDVSSGQEISRLDITAGDAQEVSFTSDHRALSVLYDNSVVAQWSIPDGDLTLQSEIRTWNVPSAAFDPSSQRIVYAGSTYEGAFTAGLPFIGPNLDPNIYIFDLRTSSTLRTYRGHSQEVTALAWSTDGRVIVSGSKDGTIRIWSAENLTVP